MASLRYVSEADVAAISEIANQQFSKRPDYQDAGGSAFIIRGSDGHALLSSAMDQPRWPYHRTLQRKAGVLQYHLNVNHPFVDGNKRFALTAMILFLAMNQAFILATEDELFEVSIGIADGSIDRDALCDFVDRRTVRTTWSPSALQKWRTHLAREPQEEACVRRLIASWVDIDANLALRLWLAEATRGLST